MLNKRLRNVSVDKENYELAQATNQISININGNRETITEELLQEKISNVLTTQDITSSMHINTE